MLFFAISLFVSAVLLFLVQPMVGKMILPALGGTPAVWNTCMVFFQAVLLAGYAYSHGTIAWLGVRRQVWLHVVVLLLPLMVLPIAIDMSDVPTEADNPIWWLLLKLAAGVGLPFFVVSTHAPLLQRWFSKTGHPAAEDPYFLYGASNIGSLLALLGYPLVVERLLPVSAQSKVWAIGYLVLAVLVVGCAVLLRRSVASAASSAGSNEPAEVAEPLGGLRQLRWVMLAAVPSSLMLGVTTHITTDLAPVPLLWVIPLALYLLTFVLVFARRPLVPHEFVRKAFPFLLVPMAIFTVQGESQSLGWLPVLCHLLVFFVSAMACHGELVADRPRVAHLTRFYFWMSLGGVVGGLFNAVVAPLVFKEIAEYPLMMAAAAFVLCHRWRAGEPAIRRVLDFTIPIAVSVAAYFLIVFARSKEMEATLPLAITVTIPAAACLMSVRRPLRLALSLGLVLIASHLARPLSVVKELYTGRNFFGVKIVTLNPSGYYHVFLHGRTIHGIQDRREERRRTSLAYFHRTGPIGDVFSAFKFTRSSERIAIIGLGAGSLATYPQPGQPIDFYEIDPEVARIAENPELFSFLSDCRGQVSVILGDGRLAIASKPHGYYGLIVLDAFASDAVPTHLLTREALQTYLDKLDEGGLIVFNVSNSYLSLAPLLAALAEDAGLVCRSRYDQATDEEYSSGKMSSEFVVMARSENDLGLLRYNENWVTPSTNPDVAAWTDQFSNILSVVNFR